MRPSEVFHRGAESLKSRVPPTQLMVGPDQLKFFLNSGRKKPLRVPVDKLVTHPAYPESRLQDISEIEEKIRKEGFDDRYPLRAIPHPTKPGFYQLMDGHRRLEAVKHCLHGPGCPQGIHKDVPVVVEEQSKEDLDSLYHEDNWKRYPLPKDKVFDNPKYCPQCGSRLAQGDHFCPECGLRLR